MAGRRERLFGYGERKGRGKGQLQKQDPPSQITKREKRKEKEGTARKNSKERRKGGEAKHEKTDRVKRFKRVEK